VHSPFLIRKFINGNAVSELTWTIKRTTRAAGDRLMCEDSPCASEANARIKSRKRVGGGRGVAGEGRKPGRCLGAPAVLMTRGRASSSDFRRREKRRRLATRRRPRGIMIVTASCLDQHSASKGWPELAREPRRAVDSGAKQTERARTAS
jgi:hypothetical protein